MSAPSCKHGNYPGACAFCKGEDADLSATASTAATATKENNELVELIEQTTKQILKDANLTLRDNSSDSQDNEPK